MIGINRQSVTCALGALVIVAMVTPVAAETAMEEAFAAFRNYRADCTSKHSYDPDNLPALSDFETAPGEAAWRSCVYQGVEEILIPKSAFPVLYSNLIATDRRLAKQVKAAQLTRDERRTLIEELIADIKATESAHAAMADSAKTTKSVQERKEFTRRMVNDLRGFLR